jgi:pyridoxal phosphate enzyme (YggS family)
MHTTSLESRYHAVIERVQRACEAANRAPDDIQLLAVSKTKPSSDIESVYSFGQRHFGENYVQEWLEKANEEAMVALPELHWHFIGNLQRNKCKFVAGHVKLIHSVHSVSLAKEIEKRTPEGAKQAILLQFNVGHEESKSGFNHPDEVAAILSPEEPWSRLSVQGLMSIPPFTDDPEEARTYHRTLRQWRDELQETHNISLPHLSMGMSHDMEIAIEEGATFIRVGTAIFGPRN